MTANTPNVSRTATAAFDNFVTAAGASADPIVINAPAGAVRGRRLGGINVFTGIPFGASTAGANRFRAPQPAARWTGVFDATRPAAVAPQVTSELFPALPGVSSEDCLQLNIWAPATPGPHPVMVWIHGGGNVQGACGEPIFDSAIFARDGIVAVNINYRLGALGFLELGGVLGPDHRGSANNALRDQLLALAWVQHNITAFGGDPASVTVTGESAGGFALCSLLASPAHNGMVKRAIVSSGGQAVQDIAAADAFARIFVEQLGGPDRLLTASFAEILGAQNAAMARWLHALPFANVVDLELLPAPPIEAFTSGSAKDVDLMIGWCRDETRMMIPEAAAADPAFMPPAGNVDPIRMQHVMTAYAQAHPTLSRAELLWKATTAEYFAITSMRIADAHATAGGRVLRYRLDYTVPAGPLGDKSGHGADVPLVFGQMDSQLAKVFGYSAADAPMQRTVHAIWSSFIRTGAVEAGLPNWPAYDSPTGPTMILDRRPRVASDIDREDRQIWAGTL